MFHDGYVEEQTVTNLSLFFFTEEDKTPFEIAILFREVVRRYLNEEKYPEDIKNMFRWVNDDFSLYEYLGSQFDSTPDRRLDISKIISFDKIINFLTDCDDWAFREENYNKHTNQPHVFEVIWEKP